MPCGVKRASAASRSWRALWGIPLANAASASTKAVLADSISSLQRSNPCLSQSRQFDAKVHFVGLSFAAHAGTDGAIHHAAQRAFHVSHPVFHRAFFIGSVHCALNFQKQVGDVRTSPLGMTKVGKEMRRNELCEAESDFTAINCRVRHEKRKEKVIPCVFRNFDRRKRGDKDARNFVRGCFHRLLVSQI